MRLAAVRCRICCYTLFYLLMMPAARLVCQRPSSNFPYFRTPLANFLLSRSNSVENGNSKTTTLLHSAKCTRSLFQGRTGCGGRPSVWHDIVTCQRLVLLALVVDAFLGGTPKSKPVKHNTKKATSTSHYSLLIPSGLPSRIYQSGLVMPIGLFLINFSSIFCSVQCGRLIISWLPFSFLLN